MKENKKIFTKLNLVKYFYTFYLIFFVTNCKNEGEKNKSLITKNKKPSLQVINDDPENDFPKDNILQEKEIKIKQEPLIPSPKKSAQENNTNQDTQVTENNNLIQSEQQNNLYHNVKINESQNQQFDKHLTKPKQLLEDTIQILQDKQKDLPSYDNNNDFNNYLVKLITSQNGKDTILDENEAKAVFEYISFNIKNIKNPQLFKYLNHTKIDKEYKIQIFNKLKNTDILLDTSKDARTITNFKLATLLGIESIVQDFIDNKLLLNSKEFKEALYQSIIVEKNSLINIFLKKNPKFINYQDDINSSILVLAAQYNNNEAINIILSNNAFNYGTTETISDQVVEAIIWTLKNGNIDGFNSIVNKTKNNGYLLENILKSKSKKNNLTIYEFAFQTGKLENINAILNFTPKTTENFKKLLFNCRFTYMNKKNYTPLILTSKLGYEKLFTTILESENLNWENKKPDINNSDSVPQITLAAAIALKNNNISIFTKIIEKSKSKKIDIINEHQLIIMSLNYENFDGTKYLIENCDSLNLDFNKYDQGVILLKNILEALKNIDINNKIKIKNILFIIEKLIDKISFDNLNNIQIRDTKNKNTNIFTYFDQLKISKDNIEFSTELDKIKIKIKNKETKEIKNTNIKPNLKIIIENEEDIESETYM